MEHLINFSLDQLDEAISILKGMNNDEASAVIDRLMTVERNLKGLL